MHRRWLTDTLGYLLLIAAVIVAPLPGPGGVPVALVGLGLLSIHNPWAQRLRVKLASKSDQLSRHLLRAHPAINGLYDLAITCLIIVACIVAWQHGARWQTTLAGALIGTAIALGYLNRNRYIRLFRLPKRKL